MSTITPLPPTPTTNGAPPRPERGAADGPAPARHDPLDEFLPGPGEEMGRSRPAAPGRAVGGLILVALGLFFLAANVFDAGGALLFLGLGTAFLVARLTTGRYGFAVPAGILLGFGTFVFLSENQPAWMTSEAMGGWFFILLGAGFLATYVIGGRPRALWPLIPAAALAAFGVVLAASVVFRPLAPFAWIGAYWPLILVLLGAWFLLRDRVAPEARRPMGYIVGAAIAAYAILAMAAAIAASSPGGPSIQSIQGIGTGAFFGALR